MVWLSPPPPYESIYFSLPGGGEIFRPPLREKEPREPLWRLQPKPQGVAENIASTHRTLQVAQAKSGAMGFFGWTQKNTTYTKPSKKKLGQKCIGFSMPFKDREVLWTEP